MDAILGYVTVRLEILIADLLGAAANQSVAGSITWADLAAVACYLVLAAAVSVAVTYFIKRRSRSLPAVQSTTLPNHVLTAIRKPIHILIWIYGVYFAATPVLLKLRPEQGLLEIREVLLYSLIWALSSPSFGSCSARLVRLRRGSRCGQPARQAKSTICWCRLSARSFA